MDRFVTRDEMEVKIQVSFSFWRDLNPDILIQRRVQ
jgi:hypothetical protein